MHLKEKLKSIRSSAYNLSTRRTSNKTFDRNRETLHDLIMRKLKTKYIDTNPFFQQQTFTLPQISSAKEFLPPISE